MGVTFDDFVASQGPLLRAALISAYGPEVGDEAASDALAYGWQHWDTVGVMANPTGYLYRVGQSAARRYRRPAGYLPPNPWGHLPHFEPLLAPALESLSEPQRLAVILIHALGWTQAETAQVLDVSISSVRTHLRRGMTKLRASLKADANA